MRENKPAQHEAGETPIQGKVSFQEFRQRVDTEENREMDELSVRAAAFFLARRQGKKASTQEPAASGGQTA